MKDIKVMKSYIQPSTEVINYQTLDICNIAGQMYSGSVVGGNPLESLSPTRIPGVCNYPAKTLYI